MRHDSIFVLKTSLFFCALSAAFSLLGLFLEPKAPIGNLLPGFTIPEISGHLLWGLVAGAATLSLRYTLMGGAFAVLIDSDHLVGLTHLEAVSRLSHSIFFGIIVLVLTMVLFGKKDYRLGAVAFSAILAHVSFDIFYGDHWFPFFAPIYNNQVYFGNIYWVIFEAVAIAIVGIVTVLTRYQKKMVQRV
jgi:hypothetical protein